MTHRFLLLKLLTNRTLTINPTTARTNVLMVSGLYGYIIDSSLQKKLR
jgi:hypothetical protein